MARDHIDLDKLFGKWKLFMPGLGEFEFYLPETKTLVEGKDYEVISSTIKNKHDAQRCNDKGELPLSVMEDLGRL